MRFVEGIRAGAEGLEAGLGAEIDRPAAVLNAREVAWIRIAEDSSAEGDEARRFFGRDC